MKKLTLWKAANDFAFANVETNNAITLQQGSLSAFVAGGFDQADLGIWNQAVTGQLQVFRQMSKQKLPSENIAAVKPEPTMPPAAAEPTPEPPKQA